MAQQGAEKVGGGQLLIFGGAALYGEGGGVLAGLVVKQGLAEQVGGLVGH
ncbi:MAG: hypothetical protein WKG07_13495 [Hymenobacter sp.]